MEQERFVEPGRAIGFFRQLEERLLNSEVRSSGDELSRLLADDFIEFGSSGAIYNKQQIIGSLAREQLMEWSIADFSVRVLADDVVRRSAHLPFNKARSCHRRGMAFPPKFDLEVARCSLANDFPSGHSDWLTSRRKSAQLSFYSMRSAHPAR
jgi:hypothetical protein